MDSGSALLLTYDQAAALLNLSRRTVWTLVSDGQIGAVRLARAVRIPRSELERWISDHTEGRQA